MTMTCTQHTPTTTDAGISVERRSATTAPGGPATITTVTERDTASDAGPTGGYHVVMFSTAAAAVPLRPTTITRRLIDTIRVVGAALHRPPARRHSAVRWPHVVRRDRFLRLARPTNRDQQTLLNPVDTPAACPPH